MVTQHLKQREREGKISLNENNWIVCIFNSKLAELYIVQWYIERTLKKKKNPRIVFTHTCKIYPRCVKNDLKFDSQSKNKIKIYNYHTLKKKLLKRMKEQ